MSELFTVTYVPTTDIRLSRDAQTRAANLTGLSRIFGSRPKVSGTLKDFVGEPGKVSFDFSEPGFDAVRVCVATCGQQKCDGLSALLESDHVWCKSTGGNAYNEFDHLNTLVKCGARSDPPRVFQLSQKRPIITIETEGGVRSIGAKFPDDISKVLKYKKHIDEGTVNISDFPIAGALGEPLDHGHSPLLNPTSSKWWESGRISAKAGRSPSIAAGLWEIPKFLRGALPQDTSLFDPERRIIFDPIIKDDALFFASRHFNPTIVHQLNTYGWQFTKLFYDLPERKRALPCDLVITHGSSGGAVRIEDRWAFSSAPGLRCRQMFGDLARGEQSTARRPRQRLTDFDNITDSSGCGDAVAAIQAHFNTDRKSIRQKLASCSRNGFRTNDCILDVAELVFISVVMRMFALFVYHTSGTSLAHLASPMGVLSKIISDAAAEAIKLAQDVQVDDLHPHETFPVHSSRFDISIALWLQDDRFRWQHSPRRLRGVVRDMDEEGELRPI